MPSDGRGKAVRAWRLLGSQGFGIACGLATVALLAVGSFVLAGTADGVSADVAMDDVTAFFREPSAWHAWFYLLLPVLALYGLSTAVSTVDSVRDAWRSGRRALSAYAPAILHVSFLAALLAHAVGGFLGREDGVVAIGPGWTSLPGGDEARAIAIDVDPHPDGSPRQVTATIERRGPGEDVRRGIVAFNAPWSEGLGTDLLLLLRASEVPSGARLSSGPDSCELPSAGSSCTIGGRTVTLAGVRAGGGHHGGMPVAILSVAERNGPRTVMLWPGARHVVNEAGASFRLEEIVDAPSVMVRARHAPGNPWALAAAVLLLAGLAAMGRRWGVGTGREAGRDGGKRLPDDAEDGNPPASDAAPSGT